jgi:hypothetical protein
MYAIASLEHPYCCSGLTFSIQLFFIANGINIASPLIICTKEEQLAEVLLLWAEGVRRQKLIEHFQQSTLIYFARRWLTAC